MTYTKLLALTLAAMAASFNVTQAQTLSDVYVGINAGTTLQTENRGVLGANLGYMLCKYFHVEATYDYNQVTGNPNNAQMLMVNAVAGVPNISIFTPYVLAGTGVGWNAAGSTTGDGLGLYNVGVGFKVALSDKLSLDNRYRYVAPYNAASGRDAQVITTGLNYRF